jgi:hypothetical protein
MDRPHLQIDVRLRQGCVSESWEGRRGYFADESATLEASAEHFRWLRAWPKPAMLAIVILRSSRGLQPCQSLAVVPRHPVRRFSFHIR